MQEKISGKCFKTRTHISKLKIVKCWVRSLGNNMLTKKKSTYLEIQGEIKWVLNNEKNRFEVKKNWCFGHITSVHSLSLRIEIRIKKILIIFSAQHSPKNKGMCAKFCSTFKYIINLNYCLNKTILYFKIKEKVWISL